MHDKPATTFLSLSLFIQQVFPIPRKTKAVELQGTWLKFSHKAPAKGPVSLGSARQVKRKDIHAGSQAPKLFQVSVWGTLSTGTGIGHTLLLGFSCMALPSQVQCLPLARTHMCRVNKHQDDAFRGTSPISADSGYCPASWAPQQEPGSWPHPLLHVQVDSQPSPLTAALQKTKLSFAVSG